MTQSAKAKVLIADRSKWAYLLLSILVLWFPLQLKFVTPIIALSCLFVCFIRLEAEMKSPARLDRRLFLGPQRHVVELDSVDDRRRPLAAPQMIGRAVIAAQIGDIQVGAPDKCHRVRALRLTDSRQRDT